MRKNRFLPVLLIVGLLGGLHFLWSGRSGLIERLPGPVRALLEPPAVTPAPGVISMGGAHVLALRADGALHGWGSNREQELGLAQLAELPIPKPVAAGDGWRYVSTGNTVSYAIAGDGRLWRRGFRKYRRYGGQQPLAGDTAFEPLFSDRRWRKVLESQGITVGLDAEGRLWHWDESVLQQGALRVTGSTGFLLQLGADGRPRHESDAELEQRITQELATAEQARLAEARAAWTAQYRPWEPAYLDTPAGQGIAEKIRQQVTESVALSRQQLELWRQASLAARDITLPLALGPAQDWVDFCVDRVMQGKGRIYAVDAQGGLWKSGDPQPHARASDLVHFELARLPVAARFTRVFCRENAFNVFALDETQRLWGFGHNFAGTLGDGDGDVYGPDLPVAEADIKLLNGRRWVEIAQGRTATYGISRDGSLWGWGQNHQGVLGTGDDDSHHTQPTLIDDQHVWIALAAGAGAAAAITADGELYTWGANHAGVLGEGGSAELRDRPGLTAVADGWWRPAGSAAP